MEEEAHADIPYQIPLNNDEGDEEMKILNLYNHVS